MITEGNGSWNNYRLGGKAMNEAEYYASEFTDAKIDALADAGEFYLEEWGFSKMPTQEEMKILAIEGKTLLLLDWFNTL